jgi:hypothetical protein
MMTPSGLSMGTMRKSRRQRSAAASRVSEVMKSRIPCIIHEAFDSPGCTRAETATTARDAISSSVAEKSVT